MKYVLLTGAYGGMGRAVLSALKKAGYFVFAADKTVGEAEENILPIQTDITNSDSVKGGFRSSHGKDRPTLRNYPPCGYLLPRFPG